MAVVTTAFGVQKEVGSISLACHANNSSEDAEGTQAAFGCRCMNLPFTPIYNNCHVFTREQSLTIPQPSIS